MSRSHENRDLVRRRLPLVLHRQAQAGARAGPVRARRRRRGHLAELPAEPGHLARRFGPEATAMTTRVAELAKAEGLDFDFGAALTVNTLDSHRLLHLAADAGVGDAAKERLLRAHFTEGADLSDHDTLTRLLTEAGVDEPRVL